MGRLNKSILILSIFQLCVGHLKAQEEKTFDWMGSSDVCPLNMDSIKGQLTKSDHKIEKSLDEQTAEILEQIKKIDVKNNLGVYETFIENTIDKKLLNLQAKSSSGTIEAVYLVSMIINEKFSKIEKSVEHVNDRLTKMEEALSSSAKERSILAEKSDTTSEAVKSGERVENRIAKMEEASSALTEKIEKIGDTAAQKLQELNNKLDNVEQKLNSHGVALTNISAEVSETVKRTYECALSSQLELITLSTGKYHYTTETMSWYEAKIFCEKYGMQLLTINTKEEAKALVDAKLSNSPYWTSASDIGRSPGNFYWANGQPTETWIWKAPEPNTHAAGRDTCAYLKIDSFIGDNSCSSSRPFICEMHPFCKKKRNR